MALEAQNQNAVKEPQNFKGLDQLAEILQGKGRVSDSDRMFFTEQLGLLLETGVSLHPALNALKQQTDNPAMVRLIDDVMSDVSEGKSFSHALARHKNVFPGTYVNLIAASESGGFMHEVMQQLLEMDEKREELKNTLISAFSYPAFLVLFSLGVVAFVLVVVFPKFADMFSSIRDQLPLSTLLLMTLSDLLTKHWLWVGLGSIAFIVACRQYLLSATGIRQVDYFKLNFPGIKQIFIQIYLVQAMRVMSLSLGHGVSVMDTLDACKEVVKNRIFQKFLDEVETKVQEGAGIAIGFNQSDMLPPIVKQMVSTGEETGSLPKVMARISDHFERELKKRLEALSKLAEPLMLVVMGVVVGMLVSSLILPIFKLSRAVH